MGGFYIFTGGSQAVLLKRMYQLGTAQALSNLLASESVKLLGGGSAGAMAMGEWCILGHTGVKDVVPGLDYIKGCVVDSHFTERDRLPRLQSVLQNIPGIKGIGIDEDTAVLLGSGVTIEAIYGDGTVTICDNKVTNYDKNSTFPS